MPDVPTAQEAGAPAGFDVNAFVVLVAPKGLPAPVRAKINADMGRLLADPEVRARFDTFAFEPIWSPEEIARCRGQVQALRGAGRRRTSAWSDLSGRGRAAQIASPSRPPRHADPIRSSAILSGSSSLGAATPPLAATVAIFWWAASLLLKWLGPDSMIGGWLIFLGLGVSGSEWWAT